MDSNTLKSEIEYLKALAEDGGRTPIINGGALFWAGIMFGGASLIHYSFISGLLDLPNPWFIPANWLLCGLVYAILSVLSVKSSVAKYGPGGLMNKAIGTVWSGVGISIFVVAMCLIIAGSQLQALEQTMSAMAPAVLVLYGLGWWAALALSGQKWLGWVCMGSFAGAMAISALAGQAEQFIAYAACLILFATVPGLVIMAKAKQG